MGWFANKGQILQLGATVIFSLFGGAAVLAAITGMAQKVMGLPLDWWILILVFVGGFLLMWWSQFTLKKMLPEPGGASEAKVSSVLLRLKPTQILHLYPSKNAVLWEWVSGVGMTGPFCSTHKVRLFYWDFLGKRKAEIKETDYLSGNGSFVCPIDDEEFVFIRPMSMQVCHLRAQAMERFDIESDRRKLSGE